MRLMADGVPVELYCAAGEHHGKPEDMRTARHAASLYQDAIKAAIS